MKKFFALLLLLSAYTGLVYSQQTVTKVPDHFKNMNMRSIGPAVMSGRVTAIDVDPLNENIIYVGTASGGLWKSESAGMTWAPIFDEQEVLGIGSVEIDPSNHDVIWAGTGEGNPRNSQTNGAGIYRSLDAGKHWQRMGLENTSTIHRVLVDPRNSQVVYAGAHGNAWNPSKDRGVYKTIDGGKSWQNILFVNDTAGCADLVMDPFNSNRMLAAMYHYQRKPYHFTSGGKGSGLHLTVDGGATWTKLTDKNGLPEGELGRIGLAFARSNSKVVYALIECAKTGLYRSNNGGLNWELVTEKGVGDRPFYYHELYVDPSNENHLIYLHSTVSESIDGGKTWTTLLPYYGVHPDHHAFWWSANNTAFMIEGNDGGLNISRDGGRNWTFVNNLPLGQFYHVDIDMQVPYNVYGGMQDNGSWKGPGYVFHSGGIRSADWQELLFGDGFDVLPDSHNPLYAYAMSQGGEVHYIQTESGKMSYVKPVHPEGKTLRFNWNAGIGRDPFDKNGVYFGSQFVHHSSDHGLSWEIISPDLTTNDSLKLKDQNKTGGITPDVTNAENHCTILCITASEKNQGELWVGTDDGNVQLTRDGGKNWTNLSPAMKGLPKGAWVPQITLGANAGEAWVVVNNYRQGDRTPYLFYTADFGKTWINKVSATQVYGHCLSVVQDMKQTKLVFLGTEHGLYVSFDYGSSWMKWTHDYPSVATQDLKIHPRENDLIIGTFGRALYVLDNIEPLRRYAQYGEKAFEAKMSALPSPTAYISAWQQPAGERFPADTYFAGENKQTRGQLSYYFNVEKKEETKEKGSGDVKKGKKEEDKKEDKPEEKKKDQAKKVSIHVLTLSGDTIRTLKHEPDTGINVVGWWFDTRGIRFPSKEDPKKEDDEEGNGPQAAPGKYKIVYQFNEWKDSTELTVEMQPNVAWTQTDYERYSELVKRAKQLAESTEEAMQLLRDARKSIGLVRGALTFAQDTLKKELESSMDSLDKKINGFEESLFGKEEQKGINDNAHTLQSKIYTAFGHINEYSNGRNADDAVRNAERDVNTWVNEVKAFANGSYADFKKRVKGQSFDYFKKP
ncbi:MAG: VPS10 domain-containing protein [Flavobacteriales bacterium]